MISSQRGGQSVNSFTHSGRERVGLSDHKHTHKGGGRTREERGNALSLSLSLSLLLLLSLSLSSSLFFWIRSDQNLKPTQLMFTRPRTLSFEFLEVVVFFDCYLFRHLLVFVVVHRRHAALSLSLSLSLSLAPFVLVAARRSPSFSQFSLSPASFSLQMIFFSFRR